MNLTTWGKPGLTVKVLREALGELPEGALVHIEDSYGTTMLAGMCDPRGGSLTVTVWYDISTGERPLLEMVPVEPDMYDED